ncbi:MAG: hypothetical protein J5882_04410 [Bacteroidales bacterium]|nr:hypothetical protein [Bacteroidales bacterium]
MIKKFIYAVSAALMISALASCAQSGNQNTDTQNNAQQPTEQTQNEAQPEAKPADNAQAAPKDTNKKYMCVACNEYFDNAGNCEKCGMELIENVDYVEK